MSKRAIVYIDGYNLYYGLIKGTRNKWLDLWAFSKALLQDRFDLVEVKYFTAAVKTHPYDPAAVDRQKIYLQALRTVKGINIIHGFYAKNKTLAPYAADKCGKCDVAQSGYLPIYKLEEKRSDVNLAVSLVSDAACDKADCLVVVTGDSDQVGAIETARYMFKKQIVVFNPHIGESKHLKRVATFYKNIPRDLPAQCQLPETIPVGTHGKTISRPPSWA